MTESAIQKLGDLRRAMLRDTNRFPTEFRVGLNQAERLARELVGIVYVRKGALPPTEKDMLKEIMSGKSLLFGVPLKVVLSDVGYCPPGARAPVAEPDLLMAYHPEVA